MFIQPVYSGMLGAAAVPVVLRQTPSPHPLFSASSKLMGDPTPGRRFLVLSLAPEHPREKTQGHMARFS